MTPRWWRLLPTDLPGKSSTFTLSGLSGAAQDLAQRLGVALVSKRRQDHVSLGVKLGRDCRKKWHSDDLPLIYASNNRAAVYETVTEISAAGIEEAYLVGSNAVGVQTTAKKLQAAGVAVQALGSADRHRAFHLTDLQNAAPLPLLHYELSDQAPAPVMTTQSAFAAGRLDAGSRLLMRVLDATELSVPANIVDLASGCGPLALWAANRWPSATVTGAEDDAAAVAMIEANAQRWGFQGRLLSHWWCAGESLPVQTADLVLCNPPFHQSDRGTDFSVTEQLLQDTYRLIGSGGVGFFVTNRQLPYEKTFQETFQNHWEILHEEDTYKIFAVQM
jgi:16S rRNA G1207 methylase RsmC